MIEIGANLSGTITLVSFFILMAIAVYFMSKEK